MRKKPNFEQVPLEVVKKIVEEQVNQEETESGRETKKKELEQLEQLLLLARLWGKQKKHDSYGSR
jgi:DNA recombination-dependent growth factor C